LTTVQAPPSCLALMGHGSSIDFRGAVASTGSPASFREATRGGDPRLQVRWPRRTRALAPKSSRSLLVWLKMCSSLCRWVHGGLAGWLAGRLARWRMGWTTLPHGWAGWMSDRLPIRSRCRRLCCCGPREKDAHPPCRPPVMQPQEPLEFDDAGAGSSYRAAREGWSRTDCWRVAGGSAGSSNRMVVAAWMPCPVPCLSCLSSRRWPPIQLQLGPYWVVNRWYKGVFVLPAHRLGPLPPFSHRPIYQQSLPVSRCPTCRYVFI